MTAWGVEIASDQVVGDRQTAQRVSARIRGAGGALTPNMVGIRHGADGDPEEDDKEEDSQEEDLR